MSEITVFGLGPGDIKTLTLEVDYILKEKKVVLRTKKHPCIETLVSQGYNFESFDSVYDSENTFEEVYSTIVDNLIKRSKEGKQVFYGVPGNPLFNEKTVELLIKETSNEDIKLNIIPGLSYIDVIADALKVDLADKTVITDTYSVLEGDVTLNPNLNHLISEVWSQYYLSELKLKVMEIYPDDQEVIIVNHAGLKDQKLIRTKLYELDHYPVDYLSSVFIPINSSLNRSFDDIVRITSILRSENGCSWDRAQTHNSLKRYLIEETAEAIEALDNEDAENLKEELGDILFEILIHSQIALEDNEFSIYDVIESITEKMIRRHPHVFGNTQFKSQEEFILEWDKIKQREKNKTLTTSEEMLEIPKSLSALLASDKIQYKAKKVGFDWDNPQPALEKVQEEIQEVKEALDNKEEDQLKEELGDLLFAVVNVIRLADFDPEEVLRMANRKFIKRFSGMEKLAEKRNQKLSELSLDEQEKLWQQVKQ